MKVIGVVGFNAAGKDELVDYLHQRCDIPVVSMGDLVVRNDGTLVAFHRRIEDQVIQNLLSGCG
jgi:dephospho-CoA kinase